MEKISSRLLSWASLIDDKTVEQARTSSQMPFIHPHIALMPDAHLGLGATVGSAIPTLGAIMLDLDRMKTTGKIFGYADDAFTTVSNFQVGAYSKLLNKTEYAL